MIGFLQGTPKIIGTDLLVLVNGVGYQVSVSSHTLALASQQPVIELYIYTHVREDTLELFGFSSTEEKRLFTLLLDVSGVGPRTALGISDRGPESIITAVQQADTSFFSKIPRVGKKLAQKIIIELKGKLGSLKELQLGPTSSKEQDILNALTSLGFDENHVLDLLREEDYTALALEDTIKRLIQKMGKV